MRKNQEISNLLKEASKLLRKHADNTEPYIDLAELKKLARRGRNNGNESRRS